MKKLISGVLLVILFSVFGVQESTAGIAGNAILFDGTEDFIRIPDAPHLDGMTCLTIEAWFCPLNVQLARPIVWKSDGGDMHTERSYELQLPNSHNQAYISFFSGTSGWTALSKDEMQLVPNQWIHVAATYDSIEGIAQLYINGILAVSVDRQVGGAPISEAIRDSNADLFLGAALGKYLQGEFTYGLLDEVRLWNVARSGSQVGMYYNRIVSPDETGLIGYWNFDEDFYDQTVRDISPFNHHGFLGNSPLVESSDPSRIPSTAPFCVEYPAMDFNGDCKVDFSDLAIFLTHWLECNLDPPSACWE